VRVRVRRVRMQNKFKGFALCQPPPNIYTSPTPTYVVADWYNVAGVSVQQLLVWLAFNTCVYT